MDIVLPTRFNNPRLPVVVRPGFYDDFNRPAEQGLGVTSDGKEWNYSNNPWHIVEPGEATAGGTSGTAFVDGLSANGTLTAVCGKASTGDPRSGIVFRIADPQTRSYVGVWPNTAGVLTVYARENDSTSMSQVLDVVMVDGDTLSAAFVGADISVSLNGESLYTGHIPVHQDATLHGFTNFTNTANGTWDSIEFIPA